MKPTVKTLDMGVLNLMSGDPTHRGMALAQMLERIQSAILSNDGPMGDLPAHERVAALLSSSAAILAANLVKVEGAIEEDEPGELVNKTIALVRDLLPTMRDALAQAKKMANDNVFDATGVLKPGVA